MELIYKDIHGNETLNPRFVQWDSGQKIWVRGCVAEENYTALLQFGNDKYETVYTTDTIIDGDGDLYAEIPNSLLQEPYPIDVYVYRINGDGYGKTEYIGRVFVEARQSPAAAEDVENFAGPTLTELVELSSQWQSQYESAQSAYDQAASALTTARNTLAAENASAVSAAVSSAQSSLESTFDTALDGYRIAVSSSAPSGTTSDKVITFVI